MKENDFEDILIKYPELIEENLEFLGRQVTVYGRRIDILFKDAHNRKLIIELKIGPIKDQHIGQILSYEGMLLSHDDPTIRVMLIGNRVPPNIQRSLDHHGIAWKEISYNSLKEFIEKKHDNEFLELFDTELKIPILTKNPTRIIKNIIKPHNSDEKPALFIPVLSQWIDEAFEYFKEGKDILFFYTNSNIGKIQYLSADKVYFKCKGESTISAVADLVELKTENPVKFRLRGSESDTGKYYYGFRNLKWLDSPVELQDLEYYESGKNLRNDVPGACIIKDPNVN